MAVGPGFGFLFGKVFGTSKTKALQLALKVISSPAPNKERLAGTRDLVHWASASGSAAHRQTLAKAFKQAKSQPLLIHHIGELPADQAVQMMTDYFESGGELIAIAQWLAAAGALQQKPAGNPAARKVRKTAQRGSPASRGFLDFDWVGDAWDAIGDMTNSIVDAVVKAGKSLGSVIGSALSWTVAQLTDLAKALKQAGRLAGEVLAAAAAKSVAFMQKMIHAVLQAGFGLGAALKWVVGQVHSLATAAVRTFLAQGLGVLTLVKSAVSFGESAVLAIVRSLRALGQTAAAILSAVAGQLLPVLQPVIRALRLLGQAVQFFLAEAAKRTALVLQRILQALVNLGVRLGTLLSEVATLSAAAIKTVVAGLLALDFVVSALLASIAAGAVSVMKAVATALLALGKRFSDLVLSAVALGVGVSRGMFSALLAMGYKLRQLLVALAGRAVSAIRTALEAMLAMDLALVEIVKNVLLSVAEGFRKGFFEGLVALGKAPLELMRAAVLTSIAVGLLALTTIIELFGGHRALTDEEREEALKVFGSSIDLSRVKVAVASLPADLINYVNGERPVTTMYIINFASDATIDMHVLIHELTHVWQGVQQGPLYMTRALEAQISAGLSELFHSGEYSDTAAYAVTDAQLSDFNGDFSKFNPEQQASIVEHYWIQQFSGRPNPGLHSAEALERYARKVFKPLARRVARKTASGMAAHAA